MLLMLGSESQGVRFGSCSWQSGHQAPTDLFAQRYNQNGDPVGGEFKISDHSGSSMDNDRRGMSSDVTELSNGKIVTAWHDAGDISAKLSSITKFVELIVGVKAGETLD